MIHLSHEQKGRVAGFYNLTKTIMSLSTILKRLLNDKYKTLYKAGYLNSELKITEAGRIALDHVTLIANEEALVKMAEAKIAAEALSGN